jgi:Na+/proline symporter
MIEMNMAEAIAAAVYMLLLMSVGFVFKSLSRNIDDYLKAGCRGTWWLIGVTTFMASFSAMTFTAIAGQSFVAGWSVPIITLSGAAAFLVHGLVLAPWYRQMRITSGGDVLYNRFGRAVEQFCAYYGVIGATLSGALMLLGTATFVSTVFGFPLWMLIVVVGAVVTFYASFGGSWGIMAADFVQASVLVPVVLSVTILSLVQIGGVGGLFDAIAAQGLTADFAPIKPQGHMYSTPVKLTPGLFSWSWLAGLAALQFFCQMGIGAKYISVKDGKEARKAAFFVAFMLMLGAFIWFIPPMVARLLYFDQVMAVKGIPNAGDASFAVMCVNLLPRGLIGVMAMAILSATMSSMDGSFNGTSAMVIRNVYPPLMRLLGFTPITDSRKLLIMGRCINFAFGTILVGFGLYFASCGRQEGLYSYMLKIMALVSFPASIPGLMSMFSRRTPGWSFFSSLGCGMLASLFCFFLPDIQTSTFDFAGPARWLAAGGAGLLLGGVMYQRKWPARLTAGLAFAAIVWGVFTVCDYVQGTTFKLFWQYQLFIIAPFGIVGWLISVPFWNSATADYRSQVATFYRTMHTPVDFNAEIGDSNDFRQFKLIGVYVVITGCLMLLLLAVPNPPAGRVLIAIISLVIIGLGVVMLRLGVYSGRRFRAAARECKAIKPVECREAAGEL